MPEIKNMFQKGVMNKDLDERLVPNGQYRDAMNVQVSTSESSEVGTVQNILGNIRVEDIVGEQFKCVGAVADEKNDVLYWFITSPTVDAIVEYRNDSTNQSTNTCIPILVDRNKDVLKFNSSNLITGINIIDNLLFWTDDINEPKKINIDTFKLNFTINNYTDLDTHSQMFVNGDPVGDVTEDHITVIRKRPQKAPTVKLSETSLQPIYRTYYNPLPANTTQQGFDLHGASIGSTNDNFLQTAPPIAPVVRELQIITSNTTDPYIQGDIILLLLSDASGNLPQTYNVKMKVTGPLVPITIFGIVQLGFQIPYEILEIEGSYDPQLYHLDVIKEVDTEPIFEKELIRFGTRYKYADGEYSAFSPFTQPVFFAGAFGFHPTRDPYNLAMENTTISLKLENLIPTDTPDGVVQLDILFKKERSTTIYSVDSIKINDPAPNYFNQNTDKTILKTTYPVTGSTQADFPNHTEQHSYNTKGEYEVTVENIYAALPDNQMLRPWDNVPRKALAQEITGNRVVYANYLQNYNLTDELGDVTKPLITPGYEDRDVLGVQPAFSNSVGKRSIKSLRKYYLGIVYGDEYGRETPVFTSKDASINIPFDQDLGSGFNGTADKSLRLTASLQGTQPEWAHYFKYFIKQTTGEYYNLTLDRVYRASGDDNLWISFPSSDRNKIQEGDYFSIKKQVDVEQIVPVENKIKIIDIKNEAPETIKYEYISLGTGGGSAADLSALFPDISAAPGEGVRRLLLDKNAWEDEGGLALEDLSKSDKLAVQFTIVTGGATISSEKYFVSGFSVRDNGGDDQYNLVLRKTIEAHDSWVEQSVGVLNSDDNLNITVYKLEEKNAVEFEGRFFVKIISNPITQTYLVPSASDTLNFATLAKMVFFNLRDKRGQHDDGNVYAADGIWNTVSNWTQNAFGTPNTFGNDQAGVRDENEWINATKFGEVTGGQKGFFIDTTTFVAAQDDNNNNVNYSGRKTKGNPFVAGQYINGFEGIIGPAQGLTNSAGGGTVTAGDYITASPYHHNATDPSHPALGGRHFSKHIFQLSEGDFAAATGPNQVGLNNSGTNVLIATGGFHGGFEDAGYYRIKEGGGHFIHLSFNAPGVDLHDGNFNKLDNKIIDNWPYGNDEAQHYTDFFKGALQKIRATSIYIDGAEGHIDDYWSFLTVPGNSEDHNLSYDTDATFAADYDNQWNPGYLNPGAQSVINRLTEGSRFRIVDDVQGTVYTIKGVSDPIKLYNHTSWNPTVRWAKGPGGGNKMHNGYVYGSRPGGGIGNSVAIKLQNFFDHMDGYFTTSGSVNSNSLNGVSILNNRYYHLKEAVKNFGKAHNRRVCYILQVDKDPLNSSSFPGGYSFLSTNDDPPTTMADHEVSQVIRFVDDYIEPGSNTLPTSPAIFETEPKENQDLNIYYEASDAIPVKVEGGTHLKGHLLGPVGGKVTSSVTNSAPNLIPANTWSTTADFYPRVAGWEGNVVEINNPGFVYDPTANSGLEASDYINSTLTFWREDGGYTTARVYSVEQTVGDYITKLKIKTKTHARKTGLSYYNCFSFGNGVESNRIRDDFNESYILNGVKASTVLEEPYEEERRKYGLIYSGLYNSTSGVNNLNQFIQAEKITKDIMPSYGSIQKLYARDKDLVTLCEDKIIQIFVDKDMLYNADGNTQLLATNRVLGTAEPFRGNFGISKNPESFAAESFRAYFTDKQRGAVIRLSMDGLTPISDAGMHDFFRDNLRDGGRLFGSYDAHKGDYNLSISYATGINEVCNPGFEEGLSTDIQLLSSFVLNHSFDPTTTWFYNQIFNGDFSTDPNTTSDGWGNDAASGGVSWSDGSSNI